MSRPPPRAGIPVTNCPDTFIEEVADHAMRLILATHGRLIMQDRLVREGRWAEGRPMLLKVPRLRGLTLGLIAFGHVARAVAERAKPFGLHIIAYDPFIEEIVMVERGVEPVSLPELLARADILSMHSPATASANRMIREEHFRQMKPSAIYVSTGRGPTTDEAALIKALDEGMIAGAGLDVLEQEPPGGNNPLLKMDNVILTAHVASATVAIRSGAAAAGRAGIVAGADREMADVVRQPVGAGRQRPQALAAGVDGARPEFVGFGRAGVQGCKRVGAYGRRRLGKFDSGGVSMMPFRPSRRALLAAAPLLAMPLGGGIAAPAGSDFGQFLAGVRRDAIARGIRPATIEAAFQRIAFLPRVVELDRKQPEHKMTFAEYFQKVVTQDRIDEARQKLVENWGLLQQVWQRYRVQPRFVVDLVGGRKQFRPHDGHVQRARRRSRRWLIEGRRGAMFRTELLAALKILDQGNVAPEQMVGSWAGAMGQCQFMPTTYLTYAVDFNGDGRRDIWNSTPDVLGSIGNFVSRLGWRGDESWGQMVVVPSDFDARLAGLDTSRPVSEWARLGVRPAATAGFSGSEPAASLVLPDGAGGTALLVYDNFRAIKKWNNSNYFAAAVGYIADSIGSG